MELLWFLSQERRLEAMLDALLVANQAAGESPSDFCANLRTEIRQLRELIDPTLPAPDAGGSETPRTQSEFEALLKQSGQEYSFSG